jgi:hypothetical protein
MVIARMLHGYLAEVRRIVRRWMEIFTRASDRSKVEVVVAGMTIAKNASSGVMMGEKNLTSVNNCKFLGNEIFYHWWIWFFGDKPHQAFVD